MKDIFISKDNVRGDENNPDEELDELAASIDEIGLLQPVTLRGEFKVQNAADRGPASFLGTREIGPDAYGCDIHR